VSLNQISGVKSVCKCVFVTDPSSKALFSIQNYTTYFITLLVLDFFLFLFIFIFLWRPEENVKWIHISREFSLGIDILSIGGFCIAPCGSVWALHDISMQNISHA